MTPIYNVFGSLLAVMVERFGSFVPALVGFTLLTRLVLLPIGLFQHRSTINQMRVRPMEEAIRKEFANDTARINSEIATLYKDNNVSVAAGCLPVFIQLPLMIALYRVIQMPLTYVFKLPAETVNAIADFLNITIARQGSVLQEAVIAQGMVDNFAALVSRGIIQATQPVLNFFFMGVSLADRPTVGFTIPAFIVVSSAFTTFLMSLYQMYAVPVAPASERMQRQMLYAMPMLMLWLGFTMPTSLSLYWCLGNVVNMLQSMALNLVWSPRKTLQKAYDAQAERVQKQKEERDATRKSNLGGQKGGATPASKRKGAPAEDEEAQEQPAAEEGKKPKTKEYERVLKLSRIPSPYEDEDD